MTNDTYLYPYSSAEARDRNELSLWRESHKANIAAATPSRTPSVRASTECI